MALNPMKINDLAADLPFKKEGGVGSTPPIGFHASVTSPTSPPTVSKNENV